MVFLSHSRTVAGETINKATAVPFQVLHNSSFMSHPNIGPI
jgi:hypothetical protein